MASTVAVTAWLLTAAVLCGGGDGEKRHCGKMQAIRRAGNLTFLFLLLPRFFMSGTKLM